MMRLLSLLAVLPLLAPEGRAADVLLADGGQAKAVICVPPRLTDDAARNPEQPGDRVSIAAEPTRRRLRESAHDLALILGRMTGAQFSILTGKPTRGDKRLPILIGELASEKFGPPKKPHPYKQGCSVVIAKD